MGQTNGCESVLDVTKPMRIVSKIFGFQLFTIFRDSQDNSYKIKMSPIDVLCGLVAFGCYVTFLVINILWDIYEEHTTSYTVNLASRILSVFAYTLQAIFVLGYLCIRQKIWLLLQTIMKSDSLMKLHRVVLDNNRQYRVIVTSLLAILSVFILFCFITIILHGDMNYKLYLTHACYFIGQLSVMGFMLQFIYMMMVIRWRFSALNNAFRQRFALGPIQEATAARVGVSLKTFWHDDTAFITDMAVIYDLLNDSVTLLNSCFAIQTMAWLSGSFCLNIFGFFTLYRFLVHSSWDQMVVACVYGMWLSMGTAFVVACIVEGANIARQGRITASLVHKAINRNFDSIPLMEKLKVLSQQLLHRKPEVSCGLFVYDWPYFASTVGAMAMYLCILIQFDTSKGSP
ncbi:hypothetical protein DMENIID0001_042900 [Sergentomyia squamirostris]